MSILLLMNKYYFEDALIILLPIVSFKKLGFYEVELYSEH